MKRAPSIEVFSLIAACVSGVGFSDLAYGALVTPASGYARVIVKPTGVGASGEIDDQGPLWNATASQVAISGGFLVATGTGSASLGFAQNQFEFGAQLEVDVADASACKTPNLFADAQTSFILSRRSVVRLTLSSSQVLPGSVSVGSGTSPGYAKLEPSRFSGIAGRLRNQSGIDIDYMGFHHQLVTQSGQSVEWIDSAEGFADPGGYSLYSSSLLSFAVGSECGANGGSTTASATAGTNCTVAFERCVEDATAIANSAPRYGYPVILRAESDGAGGAGLLRYSWEYNWPCMHEDQWVAVSEATSQIPLNSLTLACLGDLQVENADGPVLSIRVIDNGRSIEVRTTAGSMAFRCRVWNDCDSSLSSPISIPVCVGDLAQDGVVDDADFVEFAQAYNTLECNSTNMPEYCPADLVPDGLVDDSDFISFSRAYDQLLCP